MTIRLFIDSNAWDIFYENNIDVAAELPDSDFSLYVSWEAEFEIRNMPARRCAPAWKIKCVTDKSKSIGFFGFYDNSLPSDRQRLSGFGELSDPNTGGRFIEQDESTLIQSESRRIGPALRLTGLMKNEADVSLAARSLHFHVLTCDGKRALKRAGRACKGRIIDLKKYKRGQGLASFIRDEVEPVSKRYT